MPSKAIEEAVKATIPYKPAPRRVTDPVSIELDRVRHLRMDFEAMDLIAEQTGINLLGPDPLAREKMTPKAIATIIWACLLHEDPALTLDEVKRMPGMELANAGYLSDCIFDCFGIAMPDADADSGKPGTNGSLPNDRGN